MPTHTTFINAPQDIAWLEEIVPQHKGYLSVLVHDNYEIVNSSPKRIVRLLYFKVPDPVYLNQPDFQIMMTQTTADNFSRRLQMRFPYQS